MSPRSLSKVMRCLYTTLSLYSGQKHVNHLANALLLCQKKSFQLTEIPSITFIEGL